MLFNSIEFLLFFPFVCLVYYLIPHRFRYLFLLVCSYYFYMCWNPKYALLMLLSTLITFLSGMLISTADRRFTDENKRTKYKKWCVALSFISNLSILFFFKYYNFASDIVDRIFAVLGFKIVIPAFDVVLPVGISFYTFQALSYTMDVYRNEITPERNFLKYALFVSFFPQLVAGPIERSKNLLIQLNQKHEFNIEKVRRGLLRMLYGYFQKVVLADNIARIVDAVYNHYESCSGFQMAVASVLFAFQIYCDFGSYSNIAIGAAQVMGIQLMDNFNAPYFSRSVAEFWRRWHISLSTWFRDYLYIPLGGNRKGKLRKNINLMIVFLTSGLWHGASGHFVIWGGLNGIFQIIGTELRPLRRKINQKLHIDENAASHKILQMIITFVLIDFAWVFFRAGISQSLFMIKAMLGFGNGSWLTFGDNLAKMGINLPIVNVLVVSFAVLLTVDVCRYNHIDLLDWFCSQGIWLRWMILFFGLFFTLIFGAYGPQYDASQFIYFQF